MSMCETVKINNTEYVRADLASKAESPDGLRYVIVRTYSAGCFAGYLKRRDGKEVELVSARRLWQWAGAASLSELAMRGTADPSNCKFPMAVNSIVLTETIEIIDCTMSARNSIEGVPVWTAKK